MPLTPQRLRDAVYELASRPKHSMVGALLTELLVHELGQRSSDLDFELPIKEVHGRLDALLGRTIFEFKSDLRREKSDAEEQLTRYLSQRETETKAKYIGIATDGATFLSYELREAKLVPLRAFTTNREDPRSLVVWLDTAVATQDGLEPDPDTIREEPGKESLTYAVARGRLLDMWQEVKEHPEAKLKRQLWADLLERVYGSKIESDELFLQHTFLTIVAKTMAVRVLGMDIPSAADLLSGKPFENAAVEGAVESDFFDWALLASDGADFVSRVARQAARFKLENIETDVLKTLYESLIDPEQRHDLGEYYTPDWLAHKVCERAIERPLEQRVLDPACGSGTFLFHSIRRYLAAADQTGVSNRDALAGCCEHVFGIDIHPVAVLIARVTYLLALGQQRLRDRGSLSIPVYLGDSLQWNTEHFLAERSVLIEVPDGPVLHFPASVAQSPAVFDAIVQRMSDLSEQDAASEGFASWLRREHPLEENEERVIIETYDKLRTLYQEGRDHIWGYVSRNLSRPVWLSSYPQRADVVLGNPPWLSYRFMSGPMQEAFRKECRDRNIWEGGNVATHQDLSAYFFARSVELYLKLDGIIGFVMPYAVLSRKQFSGFREGFFGRRRQSANPFASVRFLEAWTFDEDVQPLFPVPSCVLIAVPAAPGKLPTNVQAATGHLRRRDATRAEADEDLIWSTEDWPGEAQYTGGSVYRKVFHDGATLYPRVLVAIEPEDVGTLGANQEAPMVRSRRSSQEKEPWKSLPPVRGNVESAFIRDMYLGESIAPYRLLELLPSVIPWDGSRGLLDSVSARSLGYSHLANWLDQAERLWNAHSPGQMTLIGQLDYLHKLASQFPIPALRVLYSKSGKNPAATILRSSEAVIDHTLYWAPVATEDEALFLSAVLNSETSRSRVEGVQARGQWGARHFDKLMFGLPIPKFDTTKQLHKRLASAAKRAEEVAAGVVLSEGMYFTTARRRIREALAADGISQRIDKLVGELLGPA